METFTNLPESISTAIAGILAPMDDSLLASRAKDLHERYMSREKLKDNSYIQSTSDIYAYCALRAPATYAQIYSALLQVKELVPDFHPKSVLDLGCGPGTGMWAASALWPELKNVTCIDQEKTFLTVGKQIAATAGISMDISWQQQTINDWIETDTGMKYDLIIVANVFNELPEVVFERLMSQLKLRNSGIVIIVEPGTSHGYSLIQTISKTIAPSEKIIAPYINNTFRESTVYWIHFPQKFKRPEFQRRIRQSMRERTLMASDWEEAKFSYVAFGNVSPIKKIWGRSIGQATKNKGFLTIPLLTQNGVFPQFKVMKRHKAQYNFARSLRSGECIEKEADLVFAYAG